ncbi:IS30 family transposase [Rhodobacter sp. SGA-6-6]|uniref:IS30 family transposase n=1 Tax=Rhodobacter sp. SGA-6-6 TaxID=2710882 RepID=UPI0013EA2D0D|nr:IS30 family transposase [Rhodobacter sp. SGA-6-6]NGM44586.1 IS30 family transposase [Rhodobacter sp. SGA-6-6]
MARTGRPGMSRKQKVELWQRWKAGETLSDIGRALGKHAGSVFGVLIAKGGIAPAARLRRAGALDIAEREEIARGMAVGISFRQLARDLGRAPSTISREVARNGGRRRYRPSRAEERASRQALRPKPCRLATDPDLCAVVAERLESRWSPQQVSGWLKATYPGRSEMQLSHETIYRSLFVQARGVLKRELLAHLRSRRIMRRGKTASTTGQTRGQIIGAVSIRDRPAEIEDRAVPGHWKGDLLSGARNSHIATLVERRSRFVMLVRVGGKDSGSVVEAFVRQVGRLPQGLMASLTWDRGTELAFHRRLTLATEVAVYFCDPQSPWQRGSNENTNGLLRQYFPRGMDLSGLSQDDLDAVALSLNTRPRKTLGYRTPADTLNEAVALTG